MKNITGQYRQGDILIEFHPGNKIPSSAKPVPQEDGRTILAHGEVTGHAHAFLGGALLFREDGNGSGVAYAQVATPDRVVHDEHSATPANHGVAKVTRQREYSPEAIRQVAD